MSKQTQRLAVEVLECRTNPSTISFDAASNTILYSGDAFETNEITVAGNGNTVTIQDMGVGVNIVIAPADVQKFQVA